MKQKMKRMISFVAVAVMLVSLFSVFVVPATAEANEYSTILAEAYVVNPSWEGKADGDAISFDFQGKEVTMAGHVKFNQKYHFSNVDDAYTQAQKDGVKSPVILLTAGTYTETINIKGAVRLLGANAGIDPNVKSNAEKVAWSNKRSDLSKETVIRCTIDVNVKTGANDLVLDGLTFAEGGAFADYRRNTGASEITIKNTVFNKAGNEGTNYYALYLRSSGHSRTLRLQNLYITGQNNSGNVSGMTVGFICPYFTSLYADNIAYVENKVGFLASTWFAVGVSPLIEVTNSCFYNASAATPTGYVISMDNYLTDYNKNISKDVSQRSAATLKLVGNIFYNASTISDLSKHGIVHFQFVNSGSVYDIQENYFYSQDGTTFMDSEFLVNSGLSDMSACMAVRNNRFVGAYKVPSLVGSFNQTYIDMSQNYFGRTNGETVTALIYIAEDDQRVIRTSFWVDEEMTKLNTDWDIATSDWSLAWVDNANYNVDIYAYTEGGKNASLPIKFKGKRTNLNVQLYKTATFDADGVPISVKDPISSVDTKLLNTNPYIPTNLYLQVTDPKNPQFTPIYTLTISNCGDVKDMLDFSKEYPGYFMFHPTAAKVKKGATIPYRWRNQIYLLEVGKTLFASSAEAISYGYSKGYESPTICVPSGVYLEELVLPGSCTILGEQHGVNPNVKPYGYLTQEKFESSAWTLNPLRADMRNEAVINACIRVAEGADDYVITIDGITMGAGCSYVDDSARNADNVTIIKNVLALNAGGGYDHTGADNIYMFNLNKTFGPVTDRCTFYMYDSRIDSSNGINVIGPFIEKMVLDGNFFGHSTGGTRLIRSMQSRDIADPYYAMTNCYLYRNNGEGQTSLYFISTNDSNGNLAAKTNIVYNLDGNVFNDGVQSGRAATELKFTGTNMTFYLTNNTIKTSKEESFFVNNKTTRFLGSCPSEDCSEILVIKGNRFITLNEVPATHGTGIGTMFDFSGNYWADDLYSEARIPSTLKAIKESEVADWSFSHSECVRYKADYTYLDWDMTIRSDEVLSTKSYLNLSKGMFNTGKVTTERVNNSKQMKVLRDTVSADVQTYDLPASAGEFDTVKYYTDFSCTEEVQELQLTKSVNEFYGMVYPYGYSSENTSGAIPFKIIINRSVGTEAKLLAIQGGLVDQNAKTAIYEIPNTQNLLNIKKIGFEVSAGATYSLFTNKACTVAASSAYSTNLGTSIPTLYLRVKSENGNAETVYTLTVKAITPGSCATAAISNVVGMTDKGGNVFYAEVPKGVSTVNFTPVAYFGSKIAVRNGSKLLSPASDGSYTFDMGSAESAELKLTATSQNGANSKVYTLKFKSVISNEAKLYGIENAVFTSTGYGMSLGLSEVVEEVKATVTAGATYKLYNDYECTSAVPAGPIILSGNTKVVYVKVTSANGLNSTVTRLTIHSSVKHTASIDFAGTVDKTEYKAQQINKTDFNLYLPAATKTVSLKSVFDKVENGVDVKFYADPYRKIQIDAANVQLNQKRTAVYFTIPDVSYNATTSQKAKLTGESGVINIVSDRASVTYSDANKIAAWVKPYVDYMNNNKFGIFEGDTNKKLNSDANITRNEIATVATRVMGLDVSKFADVQLNFADSVDEWAKPYVKAAVGAGMINGDLDGNTGKIYFRGSKNATREQVIKILVCICMAKDGIVDDAATYYTTHKNNIDMVYNTYTFEDEASVSDWAAPYMHMAVGKYQMVNGSLYNNKLYLNPKNNITRAEVAKMVACYLGY